MVTSLFVVSLLAEDLPTAVHFYRDVLGLPLLAHHSSRPHFDLGGRYLVLLPGKTGASSERFPLLALSVSDLDAMIQNLQAHHVSLPWGIESDLNSRWVMFHDPAGNLIELVQFKSAHPAT